MISNENNAAVLICTQIFHFSRTGNWLARVSSLGSNCLKYHRAIDATDAYDDRLQTLGRVADHLLESGTVRSMRTSHSFSEYLIQGTAKTAKKDFIDLLASEGRHYLPSKRNIGADFVSKFWADRRGF